MNSEFLKKATTDNKLYFQNWNSKNVLSIETIKKLQEECTMTLRDMYNRDQVSTNLDEILQRRIVFQEAQKEEVHKILSKIQGELFNIAVAGAYASEGAKKDQAILLKTFVNWLDTNKKITRKYKGTRYPLLENIFTYIEAEAKNYMTKEAKQVIKKFKIKGNSCMNISFKQSDELNNFMNNYLFTEGHWSNMKLLQIDLDFLTAYGYWMNSFKEEQGMQFCHPTILSDLSDSKQYFSMKESMLMNINKKGATVNISYNQNEGLKVKSKANLDMLPEYNKIIYQNIFLMQSGFPIAAKEATLRIVDKI